jgi:hypothetical protein
LNQPYSKQEYEAKLKELHLGSKTALQSVFELWKNMRIENGMYRDMQNLNCENCIGNDLKNSKNCYHCFNAVNCEDCSYLYDVLDAKDCSDMNYSPYGPEGCYEVTSTVGLKFSAFYMAGPYNAHCYYCHMMQSCKNCFGCVGLKQQQYCILNKQYSKEDYEATVSKLIDHMQKTSEWGEFFPAALSPHGYNETVAHEYFPLKEAEAKERGFAWKLVEGKDHKQQTTTVPDAINDVSDEITKEILACEMCQKNYRIIPQELKFYRQMEVPLPRMCPDCRHLARFNLRSPRKLWSRTCAECGKDMMTSYAPGRPERVYCETCYLSEVY